MTPFWIRHWWQYTGSLTIIKLSFSQNTHTTARSERVNKQTNKNTQIFYNCTPPQEDDTTVWNLNS